MSLASVRAYFAAVAPDVEILVADGESATVALAAAAFGVPPEQIAKTLALRVGGRDFLLVTGGMARLDNRKAKARFGGKATMLGPEEVERLTGHPPGGVCPFGLPAPMPIFCDESLRRFTEVLPAAGDRHSAARIAPERLARLTGAEWVDVCQDSNPASPV